MCTVHKKIDTLFKVKLKNTTKCSVHCRCLYVYHCNLIQIYNTKCCNMFISPGELMPLNPSMRAAIMSLFFLEGGRSETFKRDRESLGGLRNIQGG